MEKMKKKANILERANVKVKWSEIWDSGGTSGICIAYL